MSHSHLHADGASGGNANVPPALLFGVYLLSDGTREKLTALGAAVLPHVTPDQVSVSRLRQIIVEQIETAPLAFRFLTPQRWPLTRSQECCLSLQSLLTEEGCVYIQQTHEKPKVGIKAKTGMPLGFIWVDAQISLSDFRTLVNSEVSFFKGIPDTYYQFLDANGWPVSKNVESEIKVGEALVGSCVVVCTDLLAKSKDAVEEVDGRSPLRNQEPPRKKLKGLNQFSFRSSKDVERQGDEAANTSASGNSISRAVVSLANSGAHNRAQRNKKQLLISYVRAEAADFALQLKIKLAALGYSVYLDVHEISVGVDWQDSLNFAVSNCEVFIPLVTPRYGETLWTNREVKLADVLGKYILPVNFLHDWPPRCLAIQFATTQYVVPARPHSQAQVNGAGAAGCETLREAATWTEANIQTTAEEISQRIKALNKTGATLLSIPSLVRMKTLRKTFVGKLPAAKMFSSEPEGDTPPQNNRSLVVICLHPSQAAIGQGLKEWLENKWHTVWLSSDVELPADDSDTLPVSQMHESQGDGSSAGAHGDEGCQIAPFQSMADEADVVVVILSQDFAHSRTCKQQLFYCEQRKPLIPVHFEDFTMPGWLSMLIGTESAESSGITQDNYKETLLSRLQRVIHSATRNNLEQLGNEAKLNHAVEYIRKTAQTDSCVYIAGSTTFSNPKSAEICRAIGVHLAQVGGLSVATGGFYGAGEIVSEAFREETEQQQTRQDVWHILPDRDAKDWKKEANQNPDGTFAVASFGKTLFCGDSVRQRESIVGRCFEICILIEGGPGAAHVAEEFVWNDRAVIPISCTGGAANGKLPQKMFETPQGVSSQDWQALNNQDLTPDQVAKCVSRIVSSILQHLSTSRQQAANDSAPALTVNDGPTTPPGGGGGGGGGGGRGKKGTPPSSSSNSPSPTAPPRKKSSLNKVKTVLLG